MKRSKRIKTLETTKILTVALTIISFALFSTSLIFEEDIVVNFNLNEITKLEFDNGNFDVTGLILNNYRDFPIFTDDKITMKMVLVNKHDERLDYTAILHILHSGHEFGDPIILENRTLISNSGWTNFNTEFFIPNEGTNEIVVEIVARNPETWEIDFSDSFTKQVDVLSTSDRLNFDQNNYMLWGVIASSVIGGATIVALILNQREARKEVKLLEKQNETFEKEVNARVRPIIGRHVINKEKKEFKSIGYDEDGESLSVLTRVNGDTFSLTKEKIMIFIENTGNLPSLHMKKTQFCQTRQYKMHTDKAPDFSIEEIGVQLDPKKDENSVSMTSLGQNEFYSTDIAWTSDQFRQAHSSNGMGVYFGLLIWYKGDGNREFYYHMEGYFLKGDMFLTHVDMGQKSIE